ncbi:unnamed protein product, partial [Meganyctiphanes norvegica]
ATQQAEEDPDDPDDPAEDIILDPVISAPSSRATSPVPSTSRDTSPVPASSRVASSRATSPVPASSRVASPSKMDPSPARSTTFSGFDDDIDVSVETKDIDLSKRVQFNLSQGVENMSTSTDLGAGILTSDQSSSLQSHIMEDDDPDSIVVLPKGLVTAPALVNAPAVAPVVLEPVVIIEDGIQRKVTAPAVTAPAVAPVPVVIIEDGTIKRNNQGLRVGGTTKGLPNDVSEVFLSIADHVRYPGHTSDPKKKVIRGDILDHMRCPSTAQVNLVDELSTCAQKKKKNYDDLHKCMVYRHDMILMGLLKKDKTKAKEAKAL